MIGDLLIDYEILKNMLIWLTGVSGSGKTTIGKKLYNHLHKKTSNLIYLDGDEFRGVMGDDLGHSINDRNKNAYRLTRLCKLLSDQGLHIVCAANLTSQKFRDWCANEIVDYYEVHIEVPIEVLIKRDIKGLYKDALEGNKKNVVGVDIPFSKPSNPFLVINNSIENNTSALLDQILENIKL